MKSKKNPEHSAIVNSHAITISDTNNIVELKVEDDFQSDYGQLNLQQNLSQSGKKVSTHSISRKQSAKNSTARYREKKKRELSDLQQHVKQLENQLADTDSEIQQVKQKILTTLQTLAKMNQRTSNQNIEIYNQLEALLGKSDHKTQKQKQQLIQIGVDFDKINLLLDTLKYRIGASGRERQSKLNYHFKSIVNTLFPALYRYILFSSQYEFDMYSQGGFKQDHWKWTNQLISKLQVKPEQVQKLKQFQNGLKGVLNNTLQKIDKLNNIKQRLKQEGIQVEAIQQQIREIINPVQCAKWALFCQKYKYRKQLMLDVSLLQFRLQPKKQQANFSVQGTKGRKKVKLSQP